jgi:hypothetical protein
LADAGGGQPDKKGRIVARRQHLVRRWQVCPQQVCGWRREARGGGDGRSHDNGVSARGVVPFVTEAVAVAGVTCVCLFILFPLVLIAMPVLTGLTFSDTKRQSAK